MARALKWKKKILGKINNVLKSTQAGTQQPGTQFKAAWEPKGSRTLRLCFTDGFKQIYAIEHQPISAIRYPTSPGMKIKLIGPLTCRRGTLLLMPKNVHIISENAIEELSEEFDLKKMLTAKIGTDYVGPIQVDNQIPTRNSNLNRRPPQAPPQSQNSK